MGSVFADIFGGGSAGASRTQPPSSMPSQGDVEREASELEDMLGVGRERGASVPTTSDSTRGTSPRVEWNLPQPGGVPQRLPQPETQMRGADPDRQNQEALILIRAMVQAAKADGRLTQEEQRAILERIGGDSPDARRYLEREFQTDTNVRDFAWSVPLGLEHKVYSISLAAIDLDTKAESDYLRQLAHGLRLPYEVCNHIHQRYGIRPLPA